MTDCPEDLQQGPALEGGLVTCVPPHTFDGDNREPFPDPPVYVTPDRETEVSVPHLTPPIAEHPTSEEDSVITLPGFPDENGGGVDDRTEMQPPTPEPYNAPDELAHTGPDVWLTLVVGVLLVFAGFSVCVGTWRKRIETEETAP